MVTPRNNVDASYEQEDKRFTLSGLLRLLCCPPLPSSIGNKLAFLQLPATYDVHSNAASDQHIFVLKPSSGWELSHNDRKHMHFSYIQSSSGNRIATLYIKIFPCASHTVVFSHGNAVDIGNSCGYLVEMAVRLKTNIFCYDYSGYGLSSGVATEKNVCLDLLSVCNHLNGQMCIPTENIILYGQSIGTVPTVHLASQRMFAGVILHSSIASGLKVIFPGLVRNLWCDVFKSSSKISKVLSPILFIHGKKDDIVAFNHSTRLFELAPNPVTPLWLEDAGHNDIEFFPEYYQRLRKFVFEDISAGLRHSPHIQVVVSAVPRD